MDPQRDMHRLPGAVVPVDGGQLHTARGCLDAAVARQTRRVLAALVVAAGGILPVVRNECIRIGNYGIQNYGWTGPLQCVWYPTGGSYPPGYWFIYA
jgi:hypothetical protein